MAACSELDVRFYPRWGPLLCAQRVASYYHYHYHDHYYASSCWRMLWRGAGLVHLEERGAGAAEWYELIREGRPARPTTKRKPIHPLMND